MARILQLCAVDFTVRHFLLPLMRAQREWGFEVEAACTPGEHVAAIEAEGFALRPLAIARSRNPLRLLESYRAMRRLFRERRYDVVHVHTPVAALAGRPAARREGVPLVLYTAHGFYFHEGMRAPVRAAHVALERFAQRSADFLFSQSDEDARAAVALGISPAERTLAIGNGVDMARFRPDLLSKEERDATRAEFGFGPEHVVATMMGRLVREKGFFELLEAWAALATRRPEARLLVIGDALPSDHDDAAGEIRRRAGAIAPPVVFAGLRKDVPRLLAASDLFTLPSWREGMPRSILEAMASGLPVVATDIRGCREEVVEGETGRLVPPRAPGPLAQALEEVIADAATRRRMGAAGRLRAEKEFSEAAVIARQEAVYRRLFAERGMAWPS